MPSLSVDAIPGGALHMQFLQRLIRLRSSFTAALLLVAVAAPLAFGQVSGTISGYVKDPSGAAVPNVNVTAVMVEQQTKRTATTDAQGFYNFVAMPNGHYEVSFEVNGFDRQVQSNLQLTVNQNLR